MSSNMLNLDQQAAIQSQIIIREGVKVKDAKAAENLITKTLGVLQEQGVYAMMLFLFSRTSDEEKIAPHIRAPLYILLQQLPVFQNNAELSANLSDFSASTAAEPVLQFYVQAVCSNLDTLLLVKDLYEQTLIYARYGAKAAGKGAGQVQSEAGQ
ncbi:MAG: hypothetical protein ACLFVO_00075 [Chloroflexaceae bacterium]